MLVIALGLILIAAACAVVLIEASKSVIPLVGPPTVAAARPIPEQRTSSDTIAVRTDAGRSTYEFITSLPVEAAPLRASL
ncbi:MAG: hypothetical protein JWR52_1478 [Marmoricola sp.]|nr:hypothetical protein [Marmoricola sp.]